MAFILSVPSVLLVYVRSTIDCYSMSRIITHHPPRVAMRCASLIPHLPMHSQAKLDEFGAHAEKTRKRSKRSKQRDLDAVSRVFG